MNLILSRPVANSFKEISSDSFDEFVIDIDDVDLADLAENIYADYKIMH